MRRATWAVLALVIAGLFATECAFFLSDISPWKRCAALFWIFSSVLIVLSAWLSAFGPFLERGFWALPHRNWYLAAFFVPPALILVDIWGTTFTGIDTEGLVQLGAGMHLLHKDPSLGVFRMAYDRYHDRQYILNCIPTCLFGRSLWAARLGNSMFYIGSYLFFLSAVGTYLRSKREPDPLFFAAHCGMMIALGQYTLLSARKFEQSTMPIGVTLFFLAALILFVTRPGPLRFLWLTWAFGFFTECYTPALGSWVLAVGLLLYFIRSRRTWIFGVTIAYGIACLCVAYLVMIRSNRGSLASKFIIGAQHFTTGDWIQRYFHGVRAVVGTDYALLPAPLALALIAAIFLGWRYRDARFAAVCAWAASIVVLSLTLLGSNLNFPNYDIHRAMIIIPPLALAAMFLVIRHVSGTPEGRTAASTVRFLMGVSMVYMLFTGVFTVFLVRGFFGIGTLNDDDEVLEKLGEVVTTPSQAHPTLVYMVPPLRMDPGLGLEYFAPGARVVFGKPPPGEKLAGAYVFSYVSADPATRFDDEVFPSRYPRPYIRMDKE